jgi:hypothetical protein
VVDLDRMVGGDAGLGPEGAAVATDTVGLALLAVLDRLSPAERVAFMLHDLFAVPFDQIARVVERTPETTKKLASRARRRVHGATVAPAAETARQRRVVQAFLRASRDGDLDALLAVLAPDVVRRADAAALRGGAAAEVRGARRVAVETLTNAGRARFGEVALVDGTVGIVVAPLGRLRYVLRLAVRRDRIVAIDVVGDPDRLDRVEIAVLP